MPFGRRFAWQNKPQFGIRPEGGLPQTVPQFWLPDSSEIPRSRRRRMNEMVVFLNFDASYRTPGGLDSRRRMLAHAECVGRPPRLAETAPRNHGGASLRPGTT